MTEGVSVSAKGIEVVYQVGYDNGESIPEPAIIIRKYDQDGDVFGIIQGDQEIVVGGMKSMKQLAKAIKGWAAGERG
jgi:hypothetical protein